MAISGETARRLPSLNIGVVAASIISLVKFLVELLAIVHDVLLIRTHEQSKDYWG